MRNSFAAEVYSLAEKHSEIVLLSGDIGNRLFDPFKKSYPNRFFNCGVAEANMTSMSAGMALCGLHPITYTITPFNTYRCLEQIRLDVCYHNLPITIVGVGAGLSYASLGATHHSCEDIAMLRALPNMTVICPGDAVEVRLAVRAAVDHKGPVYIRLGKKNEPVIHKEEPHFEIGKGIVIQKGADICFLSTGNILPEVVNASQILKKSGMMPQIVSMHTVKPLDNDLLANIFSEFKLVVTVEEHSRIGGLGSAVAEWLSDRQEKAAKLCRLGTDDRFLHRSGGQANARKISNLTSEQIAEKVLAVR